MVSPKRWCNGSACFSSIASMGQLLNIMGDKKQAMHQIVKLDGMLLKEMDFFVKNCYFSSDEELVYLRSTVTFWECVLF